MTNEIKVGDILRRITEDSYHFTKGVDYEITSITHEGTESPYFFVNDDFNEEHGMQSRWVAENFTVVTIKVGSLIRVIDAEPLEDDVYANGDVFEVGNVWSLGHGLTTTQGIDMWKHEYEKYDPLAYPVVAAPEQQGDAVAQPNHYTQGKFETIEVIEEITKGYKDGFIAYDIGNVTKYLARAPFKHDTPLEDLRKAARYLDYAIKRQESLESIAE